MGGCGAAEVLTTAASSSPSWSSSSSSSSPPSLAGGIIPLWCPGSQKANTGTPCSGEALPADDTQTSRAFARAGDAREFPVVPPSPQNFSAGLVTRPVPRLALTLTPTTIANGTPVRGECGALDL